MLNAISLQYCKFVTDTLLTYALIKVVLHTVAVLRRIKKIIICCVNYELKMCLISYCTLMWIKKQTSFPTWKSKSPSWPTNFDSGSATLTDTRCTSKYIIKYMYSEQYPTEFLTIGVTSPDYQRMRLFSESVGSIRSCLFT